MDWYRGTRKPLDAVLPQAHPPQVQGELPQIEQAAQALQLPPVVSAATLPQVPQLFQLPQPHWLQVLQ
jgi:hypothetical protein